MHGAAMLYVSDTVDRHQLDAGSVLDLGGRDVNGSIRPLFARATRYVAVDIEAHPSVDIVADAAELDLGEQFDVVVSTECLEHTDRAPAIVATAFRHLRPGGTFVATMAGPGRPPHGVDGGQVNGEYYRNVPTDLLEEWLESAGFDDWTVDVFGEDVRCVATRGD